jgi:sporulation protein YlmC with PRC-barrel domain
MRQSLILTCVGLALAVPASAQDVVLQNQGPGEVRADWIVGTTVTTPEGETIGRITDILIDEEQGAVTGAIVAVGGFLGFGAKEVAVNWEDLEQVYDFNEVTLQLTREEAEAAPEFAFRERQQPPPPPVADPGGVPTAPPQ